MKNRAILAGFLSLLVLQFGTAANVQPILTGAGKLLFPESSTPATLSASSGALTVAAGGTNKNVILKPTGSGCVQLFADSPAITLCDSSGQITIAAGGTNQNVALTPSGTGLVSITGTSAAASNTAGILAQVTAGSTRGLRMGLLDSNYAWIQSYDSLPLLLNPAGGNLGVGGASHAFPLDVTGNINTSGVLMVGGTQVVGARQAAITSPTGGTTTDTQARTAINSIILTLRTHGLTN